MCNDSFQFNVEHAKAPYGIHVSNQKILRYIKYYVTYLIIA